ncbi:RNA polymerase sigma factor [Nocardia barduliensis]|uniref:RNA polymerase sigma factor n=1 Tax=Nocardia barduliensis TaxID=2736643 RepID=UPI00157169EA|nr:sigma-70 family RNA polymerase sigma factor [Nocardia barduliensis]
MGTSSSQAVPQHQGDLGPFEEHQRDHEGNRDFTSQPPGPVEQAAGAQAAAERKLFALLRAQGVQGPVWETVIVALSEYATQVLDPWIWSGEIYSKLEEKTIGLKVGTTERAVLTVNREYRQEIIAHTVVGALTKFRESMRAGRGWDPCHGAQLRTYFVTACLFEFPRVLEGDLRWRRTNQPVPAEYNDINELLETGRPGMFRPPADPIAAATDRLMITDYLATLTAPDQIIVRAVADGYTHAEIANLFPSLELTPKAVERRLHRVRRDARLVLRSER